MSKYSSGDLVYGKVRGYPPWPARIEAPKPSQKIGNKYYPVFFFGTYESGIIHDKNLFLYSENKDKYRASNKRFYKEALWEIENNPTVQGPSSSIKMPPGILQDQNMPTIEKLRKSKKVSGGKTLIKRAKNVKKKISFDTTTVFNKKPAVVLIRLTQKQIDQAMEKKDELNSSNKTRAEEPPSVQKLKFESRGIQEKEDYAKGKGDLRLQEKETKRKFTKAEKMNAKKQKIIKGTKTSEQKKSGGLEPTSEFSKKIEHGMKTKKEKRISSKLIQIDHKLKNSIVFCDLNLTPFNEALDELKTIPLNEELIKKNPVVLKSLKRCCAETSSKMSAVKAKADQVFNRLKICFPQMDDKSRLVSNKNRMALNKETGGNVP